MTQNPQIREDLKRLPKGCNIIAYGRNIKHITDLIRSAKRGTGRHFSCKTVDLGVKIVRVE